MDPRTATLVCSAASPERERQLTALRSDDRDVLRALAANPDLAEDLAERVVARILAAHDDEPIRAAASDHLRTALLASADVDPAALCGAQWIEPEATIAVLERAEGPEAAAAIWAALRSHSTGPRPDLATLRDAPETLRAAIVACIARNPEVNHWTWLGEMLLVLLDDVRAQTRGWLQLLPTTDSHYTLTEDITRRPAYGGTRDLVAYFDALAHPACSERLAATIVGRFMRIDTPGNHTELTAVLLGHVAASRPENLAAALREVLLRPGDSREDVDDVLAQLCSDHPVATDTVFGAVRSDLEHTRTLTHICGRRTDLAAQLRWSEVTELMGGSRRNDWARITNELLAELCGTHTDAAIVLLANGFDGTLAELAGTVDGITSAQP